MGCIIVHASLIHVIITNPLKSPPKDKVHFPNSGKVYVRCRPSPDSSRWYKTRLVLLSELSRLSINYYQSYVYLYLAIQFLDHCEETHGLFEPSLLSENNR